MADPELHPKGQEYGAAVAQENFISESNVSPATPTYQETVLQDGAAPEEEPEIPNMLDLEEGAVSMDDVLLGPTQRPDEAVTMGIPGVAIPPLRVSDQLNALVARGYGTSDVNYLLTIAKNLGL